MTARKVKIAMGLLKEQGKAFGRVPRGFRVSESGCFEPDTLGSKALEMLSENPELKPKHLMEALGLEYYDAWTLLKNCRKRSAAISFVEPAQV